MQRETIAKVPAGYRVREVREKRRFYREPLGDGLELVMMEIPGGEFLMGVPDGEPEVYDDEKPQHRVSIDKFFLGQMAVTQAQWRLVANQYDRVEVELNPDPSKFKGDQRPVEQVSWDEATEFCRRLSERTERVYRLPSEAQWEYACRGGTTTAFHYGDVLTDELANYDARKTYNGSPEGEFRRQTTDVGIFPPNRFGLYDMHGNILEWCEDDWHGNYERAPDDGGPWIEENRSKTSRLLRGGSCYFNPRNCRSAVRYLILRDDRVDTFGFRVCCVPPRAL